MSARMTDRVAAAMRAELVAHVASTATRRSLWQRLRFPLFALIAAALAGGGVALAVQLGKPLPGADRVAVLNGPIVTRAQGTKTIDLGSRPASANQIELQFRCLTAGRFVFADGASVTCTSGDRSVARYHLALVPGQHTTRMTVSPASARWQLTVSYAHTTVTAWGVNARGQTYGVQNANGVPDLLAVIATNGELGYVYSNQIIGPLPTSPAQAAHWHPADRYLLVYEPDGSTVIGQYHVG